MTLKIGKLYLQNLSYISRSTVLHENVACQYDDGLNPSYTSFQFIRILPVLSILNWMNRRTHIVNSCYSQMCSAVTWNQMSGPNQIHSYTRLYTIYINCFRLAAIISYTGSTQNIQKMLQRTVLQISQSPISLPSDRPRL